MSKTTYTLSFTPEVEKLASRIGGIEALTREVREELDHQFCYLGEECAFPDLGLISGFHAFTTKSGAELCCWMVTGHAEVDMVEAVDEIEVNPPEWTGITATRARVPRGSRKKR